MPRRMFAIAALIALCAPADAAEPVSVMIVGDFHMSNPGRDLHNVQVDDVLYGSGHAFLLRQCVSEMPGYRLVEANDYLPQ